MFVSYVHARYLSDGLSVYVLPRPSDQGGLRCECCPVRSASRSGAFIKKCTWRKLITGLSLQTPPIYQMEVVIQKSTKPDNRTIFSGKKAVKISQCTAMSPADKTISKDTEPNRVGQKKSNDPWVHGTCEAR